MNSSLISGSIAISILEVFILPDGLPPVLFIHNILHMIKSAFNGVFIMIKTAYHIALLNSIFLENKANLYPQPYGQKQ